MQLIFLCIFIWANVRSFVQVGLNEKHKLKKKTLERKRIPPQKNKKYIFITNLKDDKFRRTTTNMNVSYSRIHTAPISSYRHSFTKKKKKNTKWKIKVKYLTQYERMFVHFNVLPRKEVALMGACGCACVCVCSRWAGIKNLRLFIFFLIEEKKTQILK